MNTFLSGAINSASQIESASGFRPMNDPLMMKPAADMMNDRLAMLGPQPSIEAQNFADAFAKQPMPLQMPMVGPPPTAGPISQAPAFDVNSMVNEFSQMNMANQFEQFRPAPHLGPMHPWENEFMTHQHQMQNIHQLNSLAGFNQQMPMQQTHFQAPAASWANEFQSINSFLQHSRQQQQFPQAPLLSSSHIPEQVAVEPTTQSQQDKEFEDIYGGSTSGQWADEFSSSAGSEWAEAFNAEQSTGDKWADEFASAEQASSGGFGIDSSMVDKLLNSNDPKWRNSKFLHFVKKLGTGELEIKDNQIIHHPEKAQSWSSEFAAQQGDLDSKEGDWSSDFFANQEADWARQFEQMKSEWASEFAAADEGNFDVVDWEQYARAMEEAKMAPQHLPDPTYSFSQNNPYLDQENSFALGVKLLEAGKLKEAILAFEAAVQKNPEHSEAWQYLGQAQAENEQENNAIAALLKAISIDPYNLKALMMLGVSYTNDLEESRALGFLKTWIMHHPDYQQAASAAAPGMQEWEDIYAAKSSSGFSSLDMSLHDQVTRMYLAALQQNPKDVELHTVLGVLYHISSDYDKAIHHFKQSVALKPDDAALWNKLGATYANSQRSAEAVPAYQRALQLRPAYVRAYANLAIAFANQGMHEQAAAAYLETLQLNPDASNIWGYLRISLSHLGRTDLVELSHEKNVEKLRAHFPL